jgi:RNA polymerase sigma-70 factor (ECF subfamily)
MYVRRPPAVGRFGGPGHVVERSTEHLGPLERQGSRRTNQLDTIRRAQAGDHEAFDELVTRHGPWLHRLATAIVGSDDAADATQDALVLAWRRLPALRQPDRFEAWLRRILVNRCRDIGRARGRRLTEIRVDAAFETGDGGGDPRPRVELSVDLEKAIARLTIDQRTLLALHYAADLSLQEVAATLGIPGGTAKSRLNTALVELRRQLGEIDQ